MARDANIGRRNALAIPGWLLIFYSLAAIVYAEKFRSKSDFCADGSLVLIDGLCYTVWKLFLPLLLIGLGLAFGAQYGFKGQPATREQRLCHGSPSYVTLSLLISLVAVPLVFLLVQLYRESVNGVTYQVELLGIPYKHTFLLALAILIAVLWLAVYLGAMLADMRRRRDYLASPEASSDSAATVEDEPNFDEDAQWPGSRAEENGQQQFEGYHVSDADVIEIEGIGPAYAEKLAAAGVKTMARLVCENPEELASTTGIQLNRVRRWQAMAELTAVKGIGPQYAEALVRAGVESIDELKRRTAGSIAKQVSDYLAGIDGHVLGNSITETRVAGWKEAAKGMRKVARDVPDA